MKGRPNFSEHDFLSGGTTDGQTYDFPEAHVVWIATDKIDVYVDQTRDDVDQVDYQAYVERLAKSMSLKLPDGRLYGVRRPLEILPANEEGRHQLIAGESRWRAAMLAELPQVPCFIRKTDAVENRMDHITDNALRRNLSLWQQAKAVKEDQEKFGLTSDQVIVAHGLASKSELSKVLSVFKLGEMAQALVADGLVDNVNYAYELKKLNAEQLARLDIAMRKKGMPFKQALTAVTKVKPTPKSNTTPQEPGADAGAGDGGTTAPGEVMGAAIVLPLSLEAGQALASILEVEGSDDAASLQASLLARIQELL